MCNFDFQDDSKGFERAQRIVSEITYDEYKALDSLAKDYVQWMRSIPSEQRKKMIKDSSGRE